MPITERIEDRVNKITSETTGLEIGTIEALNNFQWKIVNEAAENYKSIEISGLAKMSIRKKVVITAIERLKLCNKSEIDKLQTETNEKAIIRIQKRVDYTNKNIEFLKSKLNEPN